MTPKNILGRLSPLGAGVKSSGEANHREKARKEGGADDISTGEWVQVPPSHDYGKTCGGFKKA